MKILLPFVDFPDCQEHQLLFSFTSEFFSRDWSGTLGSGERSGFVVLSRLGRVGDLAFLDGVECVNVGLERVRGLAMVLLARLGWMAQWPLGFGLFDSPRTSLVTHRLQQPTKGALVPPWRELTLLSVQTHVLVVVHSRSPSL